MMRLIRSIGSLRVAVTLLASLVALLTASTLMESAYGTPFAQKIFYTAPWFDAILGLVWINILCATLSRWPFKRRHIGFVVTHVGILTLLFGSLLTRMLGIEGQLQLAEGEERNRILLTGHVLHVRTASEGTEFEIKEKQKAPFDVPVPGKPGAKVRVHKILPSAARQVRLEEGSLSDPPNPAVEADLASTRLGAGQHLRLVERDPSDPHSYFQQLGPAQFLLKRKPGSEPSGGTATLHLLRKKSGDGYEIEVSGDEAGPQVLGDSGLSVKNLRYYPNARVQDDRVVNDPEKIKFNPAVEFEVIDAEGRVERHTKFFLFPGFGSLQGGAEKDLFGLSVRLEASLPHDHGEKGPTFTFFAAEQGPWRWRSTSSRSDALEGEVSEGQTLKTGWMDMSLTVKKLFRRAKVLREVADAGQTAEGTFAVEAEVLGIPGAEGRRWILADEPFKFSSEKDALAVAVGSKTRQVPFFLALEDFRKVDYPGTSNPASFESDVVLTDPMEGLTMRRTIQMNKPLDYKGYRIFQSSYFQDPEHGEGSVFTVAKNPGILLIYGGAPVILAGVILLFYLHPFFINLKGRP